MIAYLRGVVFAKLNQSIILLVNNQTGYKVFTTPEVLEKPINSEIELYTYHKSSDDGQSLFGLPNLESLQLFEQLITVSGVGPKSALGILSQTGINLIMEAIDSGNITLFTQIGGIGKKTAERIILELKGKLQSNGSAVTGSTTSDIFEALTALGYSTKEIQAVLPGLDHAADINTQIKLALKLLQ